MRAWQLAGATAWCVGLTPLVASAQAPPPTSPSVASAPAAKATIAVVDTHLVGADPAVGAFVTAQLRKSAESRGYAPLAQASTRAALASLRTPGPLGPADALRVARAARADRAVVANLRGEAGGYVVELHVASADGAGPWYADGAASALDLPATVDGLMQSALPNPGAATRLPDESLLGFRLALQTEAAFGISGDGFYNHLVGARADYRFTSRVTGGLYLAYANLKGKEGRVGNVLPALMLEYRIPFGDSGTVGAPLRLQSGYLPNNGPVVRVSGGFNFRVGKTTDIGLDLVVPTFWVTRDDVVISFDVAVEIGFAF